MYCDPGSTYKSFGGTSSLAACCPTVGNCNPPYQCDANQLDLWNGDATRWQVLPRPSAAHRGELTSNRSVTNNCGTLEIFEKAGDASPLYMYGCWDDYQLTRTIDKAASDSIAATAAAAPTTGSSPPSARPSGASKAAGGGARPGVVAAAAAVGAFALLVIAGLAAYIVRLRSRAAPAAPTELRGVAGGGGSAAGSAWDVAGGAGKPELPGGANAWEMGGREIRQMPAPGAGAAAPPRSAHDPAAASVRYPGAGGASPAPSWTPDGRHPFAEAPAQPHSFLEMEGSGGPRWGAELPG
jgi:hypothetical protein